MLTKVEVINSQGDILELPLEEMTNGFLLQGMEGLDPVKATLVSSSFANLDGAQYHSSRREQRNIKLQLGFEPDYVTSSIRVLRNRLYKFFMPKTEVTIRFHTLDEFDSNIISRNNLVEIVARIESFESALFTKVPAVDISFVCFDPDFINPVPTVNSGLSTAGLGESVINYAGTVENGLTFTISPTRTVDSFTIYHRPSDGTLRTLDYTSPLLSGDVLKINTVVGAKSVIRTRAGVNSSLLYAMSPQSNWLELQPGDNNVRVYATGDAVPYDLTHIAKYGGL